MMTRDRLIQLVATLIAAVCLVGAMLLVPILNKQRREEQTTYDLTVGDRTRAKYALAAAALGTFRGIVADVAWYRAERLKQEGKFYEANSLARWITTLQPRFPQVWAFHAWNLAYNISVQTHTPQERWDWVHSGIRLLREEGIPNNPNATGLYRELGWIFFHKFGKTSDDMHWFYKRMHAREWQEVLGAPTEGATTEQALARFKPIADAADRYFVDRLSVEARAWIDEFAAGHAALADELLATQDVPRVRADEMLADLRQRLGRSSPHLAKQLDPLRQMVDRQAEDVGTDRLSLLFADSPPARPVVEALRELDLPLNVETLRRIGGHIILLQYASPAAVQAWARQNADATDMGIFKLLLNPANGDGLEAVIAFLRAKVLYKHYHMDPGVMYQLMSGQALQIADNPDTDVDESEPSPLPIDWRHPAAHGIYWAYLGVRKAGELLNTNKIDLINTDRQVIHGMQELMFSGRVGYNPFNGEVDLMPDPRFIDGYEKAVYGSTAAVEHSEVTGQRGTVESYESGHENFLAKAVLFTYLYGDEVNAQSYYDRLRKLYSDKPHNIFDPPYDRPLALFALDELKEELDRQMVTRAFIDGMLLNGIRQGLALGRVQVYLRFRSLAERAYEQYQVGKLATEIAPQPRQGLGEFNRIVEETYVQYMRRPGPILTRARAYAYTPMSLRKRTYSRFREALAPQCEKEEIDVDRAFPPPPGYEQKQIEQVAPGEGTPEAIEVQ